jgi:late competence protein required for DNA uptake (superfamily II DNA/RNA helicase)
MIPFKSVGIAQDTEKITHELLNWLAGRERILNIISIPYNSARIFVQVILKTTYENKKILYITEENEQDIDLVDCIKKLTAYRDYSYLRKNKGFVKNPAGLQICNHRMALELHNKYDLVVYDDICNFSKYSKCEIFELLQSFYNNGSRIICRSIETIFQEAKTIDIPINDYRTPLTEPRIITTRIDVNKDIPYVAYEYLIWSIKSDRKVIIYVPDKEKAENVYNYLMNLRESLHNNIMYFRSSSDLKLLQNFIKNKKGIIIMDCVTGLDLDFRDADIMVYFADDRVFDYKKLIYFCGKVGRDSGFGNGEVIFLARETTKDMEIAKDIARSFNKQAWELGLLNI